MQTIKDITEKPIYHKGCKEAECRKKYREVSV